MYISDLYKENKPTLSFEIFPPKQESAPETVMSALSEIAKLNPGFISVTYGAGGTGSHSYTVEMAAFIKEDLGCQPMAHLTCAGSSPDQLKVMLDRLKALNIDNIMALRGDLPQDGSASPPGEFKYAFELIEFIRSEYDFSIGGASYPESHIDCESMDANLDHAYLKQKAGADFLISQLFFDNEMFFRFAEKAEKRGITIPLVAGIMPILGKSQVSRMIFQCGVSLPADIIRILHKYENNPEDLQKAGVDHACRQIDTLLRNGHKFLHVYSMNKPEVATACAHAFNSLV